MGYHDLSECTLDPVERRSEADHLIKIIQNSSVETLSQKEQDFVDSMDSDRAVSVKQLFWLRDIKDKLN